MTFSKSSVPYLEKYPSPSVMNIYNNKLKTLLATLKCGRNSRSKKGSFWDVFIGIGFVSDRLISLKIRSNHNCKNLASINNKDDSFTFDFKTHRTIKLKDIFLRKENTLKTLRKFIYKSIGDAGCSEKLSFYIENENLLKENLSFYLGKNEMFFQLLVPQGLRSCTKDFSIPYETLIKSTSHTNTLKEIMTLDLKK